jgi:hypothetical protein
MQNLLAVVALFVGIVVNASNVNPKFIRAIHMVESSGRTGAIVGDGGRALGPLQIHREYFNDAAEYDKSLGNDYSKVTDIKFASRVVSAYLSRYASKAVANDDFATLARVHNGGPAGAKRKATVGYWNKVQKYI